MKCASSTRSTRETPGPELDAVGDLTGKDLLLFFGTNAEAASNADAENDPVRSAITAAGWCRDQADAEIRRLVAYGREFTRPQPAMVAAARPLVREYGARSGNFSAYR